MSRIIINNKTDIPDEIALKKILSVIREGKVSNNGKQYCYVVSFLDGTFVSSGLLKEGHVFTLWQEEAHGLEI